MGLLNEWLPTGIYIKVDTPFRKDSIYEKYLMATLPLTVNALRKAEMEYHENFRHTIGWIPHIVIMIRIDICYIYCRLGTQTVAPTITGLQGLKRCIQCLASHPHKPITYPSNPYDVSNAIRLTWSENQVEYYTTHNCLEFHKDVDHDIVLNRRGSVSVIIHNLIGIDLLWKV